MSWTVIRTEQISEYARHHEPVVFRLSAHDTLPGAHAALVAASTWYRSTNPGSAIAAGTCVIAYHEIIVPSGDWRREVVRTVTYSIVANS
jgi:hypothetical protein